MSANDDDSVRTCAKCEDPKNAGDFYPRNQTTCKACCIARALVRYRANKSTAQSYQRDWAARRRSMGVTCCYKITHKATGVYYIGSTTCLGVRVIGHRSRLKRGIHPNKGLTSAYIEGDGFSGFTVEVIAEYPEEELRAEEAKLIRIASTDPLCCNMFIPAV